MTRSVRYDAKAAWACGECGLVFADERTAGKCEEWCASHPSCNLDLGRKAIGHLEDRR